MKKIVDHSTWYKAWLDTPMSPPDCPTACQPDDMLELLGVNLKLRDTHINDQMFGRLSSYTPGKVVVISKPDPTNDHLHCVWVGTPAMYTIMWTVD